jgi:Hint domain
MGGVLAGATLSRISRALAKEDDEHGHGDDDFRHGDDFRHRDDDGGHEHGHEHGHGPACYLKGTRILTPLGERKIEDLRTQDLVITVGGRAKPIEWIGSRRYRCARGRTWEAAVRPVRVARGALARNVPHADLLLSQEHCLLIDGGLIRIGDLVNGRSIAVDPCSELTEIEYLHVKLATHDAIYAEGAAGETLLLNPVSVGKIGQLSEYERQRWTAVVERPCAPVYSDVVVGARGRLLSHLRSALSPWLDRRTRFDTIRDRLWDRVDALAV